MFHPHIARRYLLVWVIAITLGTSGVSLAFDPLWGQKMFDKAEKADVKFGSVAKGADAVMQIQVKNIYQEPIQITNVGTGCGCISFDEAKQNPYPFPISIPSGQTQVLNLRLNTLQYEGERKTEATITLFDTVHRLSSNVKLPVEGYIRRDIVVTPGTVEFGTLEQGTGGERKLDIRYAGRADWKMMQPKVANSNIGLNLKETTRQGGYVNYELIVSLKPEAPVGLIRDQILMTTDDVGNPQIPIMVSGIIEPDITVTDLPFGNVQAGQTKTLSVVVRGKKPFAIVPDSLQSENGPLNGAFTVKKFEKAAQTTHVLQITFKVPDVPGPFEETFYIKVENRKDDLMFKARGRIIDKAHSAAKK